MQFLFFVQHFTKVSISFQKISDLFDVVGNIEIQQHFDDTEMMKSCFLPGEYCSSHKISRFSSQIWKIPG